MDSKSISREGVGVQVPASAPAAALGDDEFARALLGVVLHDLANATQYLTTLDALLQIGDCASVNAVAGLAETTHDVEEIGHVIGMLAWRAGADVHPARGRWDGLELLLSWGARALRREERDLERAGTAPSRLCVDRPDRGRNAAWAGAALAFAAARSLPRQSRLHLALEFRSERARLVCRAPASPAVERTLEAIRRIDRAFELELAPASCTLVFPPGAFESAR